MVLIRNCINNAWVDYLSKLHIIGAVVIFVALLFAIASLANGQPAYGDDASPVMYFYQPACVHCQAMVPILNELAAQGYRVKLMNAAANPGFWTKYNLEGTPTWLAANGDRLSGEQNKIVLESWLAAHGAKIK